MPAWASLARIAAACRHDPCNIVIRACRLRPTWQPCGLSTPAWSRSQSCLTAPRCLTPLRRPSAPPGMSLQRCRLCGAKQRRRRPASLLGTSRWVPRACSAQAGWCTGPLAILCCTCAAWVKPATHTSLHVDLLCLYNFLYLHLPMQLFTAVDVPALEEGAKSLVKEVKALPKEAREHGEADFIGRVGACARVLQSRCGQSPFASLPCQSKHVGAALTTTASPAAPPIPQTASRAWTSWPRTTWPACRWWATCAPPPCATATGTRCARPPRCAAVAACTASHRKCMRPYASLCIQ